MNVAASGLPSEIAVPAAFFAVIQMITSPIAAKMLASRGAPAQLSETVLDLLDRTPVSFTKEAGEVVRL
ncbi:hypothetical protein L6Q21_10855 [Sandaracinobacter sp. RS1-74]|uniref:hypothetical protein n=1 Tax=Sandaracinobacteroides sayramensis TaxID=2913411 RepID=UPI001EDC7830|nr:hypothetical protein [Sandaracinobacteroides sayramensis]MCG2841479.1 hypothetical protein [Sandaracinobacteroides sayramensis]